MFLFWPGAEKEQGSLRNVKQTESACETQDLLWPLLLLRYFYFTCTPLTLFSANQIFIADSTDRAELQHLENNSRQWDRPAAVHRKRHF